MKYDKVYFIGIGGIGMSAIARYFKFKGLEVSGYDRTPSELTGELEKEGMAIHYEDNPDFIPKDVRNTLVVYTPAIPADMKELVYVREHGYDVVKRSRVLGTISEGQRCLAVAGTHGKTTTSTLTAHIFEASGEGCSAFLGGISKNYGTNFLVSHNDVVVAEADEFDRSFLQLHPETAVITAMDADHLDIYSDIGHVREAFRAFASQVSGTLIVKYGLDITPKDTGAKIFTYSYDVQEADFHAENISVDGCGYFTFDLHYPHGIISGCSVGVPGWVNVENGIAAAAIALTYGIAPDRVKAALKTFSGVKRRFDIHVNRPGCAYIDDYAHHPTEISSVYETLKIMYPNYKIKCFFQPHTISRSEALALEFKRALGKFDDVFIIRTFTSVREEADLIKEAKIYKLWDYKVINLEDISIKKFTNTIYLFLGAGDIDLTFEKLVKMNIKKPN